MALSREEKIKKLELQLKQLKSTESKEKRRERVRELIQISAALCTVVSREDLLLLIKDESFLVHVANFKK